MYHDNTGIRNTCFRGTFILMARPKKDNPTKVTASVRLTEHEAGQLQQLAALCDPSLGATPNAVVRSLIRREATQRHLVAAQPEPVVDSNLDQRRLHVRLRLAERHYERVVAPYLLRVLKVSPTDKPIWRLLADHPMAWAFGPFRGSPKEPMPTSFLVRLNEILTDVEKAWSVFKKS